MMRETVDKTSLGRLRRGDKVNLERALKAGGRVSGHFVTGHMDEAVGASRQRIVEANYEELSIRLPRGIGQIHRPQGLGRSRRCQPHGGQGRERAFLAFI